MKLPEIKDFDLTNKKVIVRVDLDVPFMEIRHPDGSREMKVVDETRLEGFIPTVKLILEKKAKKVIIIGHIGRFEVEGKGLSSFFVWPVISRLLGEPVSFWGDSFLGTGDFSPEGKDRIHLMENLRKYAGEEENDQNFTRKFADLGDFYVNEAFATSHREHASIVGLPKLLPHAAGLHLAHEVDVLSGVLKNPERPVVVILGGAKDDKLEFVESLQKWADKILIGGKLPTFVTRQYDSQKVKIASLNSTGKDITLETIGNFKKEIEQAGTIVWAGPMGFYEESDSELGTKELGQAIVKSKAMTVIGGGDTEAALTKFGLVDKISFVSAGGGAMLEYLDKGDLVGLKALRN